MSTSVPKVACRKRLRNCDGSKMIQGGDEEEVKMKKMQNGDGKDKNGAPVFLEKKEKKGLNNNSSEKKTRTDDYKKGEKNGKASATFVQNVKIKKKLKVSCSKKNVLTEDDIKQEEDLWNDHSKSKSRKVSTVSSERREKRKGQNNGDCGKKIHGNGKEGEENHMWNFYSDVKDEEVSATYCDKEKKKDRAANTGESSAIFFDKCKEKKRLNTTISEKKVQRDDKKYDKNVKNGHYKVITSRKVPTAPYEKEKEKDKKMRSHDNVERKINEADRNTSLIFSKNRMQTNDGKKSTDPITSVARDKKRRPYESTKMKMQHDVKHKKRNVPSDISKEKKRKASIDHSYERKKVEGSHTLFKKMKRMQSDDNYKKIHSGKVKEKNRGDGKERKRDTSFSFFKVICNNFKEYLSVPPRVVPELEDLTNRHVYLHDSEGKRSKIRLSVVDGSLAFHRGWNNFVSDHLIKWGDFLLFEYTAKSTFSVRIFGRDSRERLHFDVRRKREYVRSHDDLVLFDVKSEDDYYFSGEYSRNKELKTLNVTVHADATEDLERVEGIVGSGPAPLDDRNGNEGIQQSRTQDMSPLKSKGKRVILITDSESSIHENDIVKLITSTADSDKRHVSADTNGDPKKVQNGIGDGQTAVVGAEKERLIDVDCGTKCTSSKCSVENTANSVQGGIENGPSVVVLDENGSLPDVVCGTKCTSSKYNEKESVSVDKSPSAHENGDTLKDDLHDSDEYLRRNQEICSTNLEYTTAVNKYSNDGGMNVGPDICRYYEAPGGFPCLEKWKSRITSHQVVLDGTGLMKPERAREIDNKFVVKCGAVGLKNPGDRSVLSQDISAGNQQIFTMPIKDPSCPDRVSMYDHNRTESYHSNEEKGIGASVELQPTSIKNHSSPDRLSKYGEGMTEISDDIDGKGTTAKLEIKMGNLEPMGSIVGTQTTNIPVCANNTAACQSEHCVLIQEDTNSINFTIPEKPEILESDDPSILKVNLQFRIPNTTGKWLELPKSLFRTVRQRKQDRNIVILKDPMMRLWPVFYHENSIFVGFTAGWKQFAAANDLQIGDLCELFKEPGDEEAVYSVQITKK